METLLHEDVKWCLNRLPSAIVKMMRTESKSLMLAGGFVRACISNEKLSDIDMFSSAKELAELYARRYADDKGRIIETCNAFTVVERGKTAVQFIHRWTYEKPEDILPSFDFTIAKAAIYFDGQNWRGICDERFYLDLSAKRLVYTSPKRIEEAGGSLLRVLKFYQRGYRIPLDSFAAVISRLITGVDFSKVGDTCAPDFERRLAFVASGLLREVDPQTDPTENAYFPPVNEPEEEMKTE